MKALLVALGALVLARGRGQPLRRQDRQRCRPASTPRRRSQAPRRSTTAPAPETADAKLHHQPDRRVGGRRRRLGDSEAALRDARFRVRSVQAQAADDSGDAAACEAAVDRSGEGACALKRYLPASSIGTQSRRPEAMQFSTSR